MLIARDLTLRRGPQPLFEQVNFTVFRGDIDLPAALNMAHVEQEIAASDRPAIEFVLDGDTELRRVQAAIEDAERRDAAMALADLYSSLEAIDGYRARARAAAIMH